MVQVLWGWPPVWDSSGGRTILQLILLPCLRTWTQAAVGLLRSSGLFISLESVWWVWWSISLSPKHRGSLKEVIWELGVNSLELVETGSWVNLRRRKCMAGEAWTMSAKLSRGAGNPERAAPSSVAGQRPPSDEMGWKGGRLYLWSVYSGPIQMSFVMGGVSAYISEGHI